MSQSVAIATPHPLVVKPLSPRIGAEIKGIRLSGELDDAVIEGIDAALLRHKVIFFRDKAHLTDEQQELFSTRLGDLVPHPINEVRSGMKAILELDSTTGSGRADA
jgi:taurine dioxygenase